MKRDRTPTFWTGEPVGQLPAGQLAFPGSGLTGAVAESVAPPKPAGPLHWYRCRDCLGVFTTSEPATSSPACGACGGKCEFQGLTEHVATVSECPCDERCTGARGRKCECSCGAENHGTWRRVDVVRTLGVTLGKPRDAAKLLAGVEAFRAAREAAEAAIEARFGDVFRVKAAGGWLSEAEFSRWRTGRDFGHDLREACAARVHSLRLSKLAKLTERVTGGAS